jgi:hypothetical protein
MLRSRLPLAVAVAALALPAAAAASAAASASAFDAPGAACALRAPRAAVEHAIPGTKLVARDPYGGRLARNRLFFDFTVRGAKADLANVASVSWTLDGTVVRTDPGVPFEWKGQSGSTKRMPAGDHTITVTVTPRDGGPVATTSFALTADNCQPAGFTAFPARVRDATFTFESAIEGGEGPDISGVSMTRKANVAVVIPRALRGRRIGTLKLLDEHNRPIKTYTLKGAGAALGKDGVRARIVPGARRFLQITGLPAGVRMVDLELDHRVVTPRAARQTFLITGTVTAGGARASMVSGGRFG